jgi:DNA alkylation repair enzyme
MGMAQPSRSTSRLDKIRDELRQAAEPDRVPGARRALRVDRGGYGEGDTVIGVSVPNARAIAGRSADLPLGSILRLLPSPIHEERLVALLLLVRVSRRRTTSCVSESSRRTSPIRRT